MAESLSYLFRSRCFGQRQGGHSEVRSASFDSTTRAGLMTVFSPVSPFTRYTSIVMYGSPVTAVSSAMAGSWVPTWDELGPVQGQLACLGGTFEEGPNVPGRALEHCPTISYGVSRSLTQTASTEGRGLREDGGTVDHQ